MNCLLFRFHLSPCVAVLIFQSLNQLVYAFLSPICICKLGNCLFPSFNTYQLK